MSRGRCEFRVVAKVAIFVTRKSFTISASLTSLTKQFFFLFSHVSQRIFLKVLRTVSTTHIAANSACWNLRKFCSDVSQKKGQANFYIIIYSGRFSLCTNSRQNSNRYSLVRGQYIDSVKGVTHWRYRCTFVAFSFLAALVEVFSDPSAFC